MGQDSMEADLGTVIAWISEQIPDLEDGMLD